MTGEFIGGHLIDHQEAPSPPQVTHLIKEGDYASFRNELPFKSNVQGENAATILKNRLQQKEKEQQINN